MRLGVGGVDEEKSRICGLVCVHVGNGMKDFFSSGRICVAILFPAFSSLRLLTLDAYRFFGADVASNASLMILEFVVWIGRTTRDRTPRSAAVARCW